MKSFTLSAEEAVRALPGECDCECHDPFESAPIPGTACWTKCPDCNGRGYTPGVVLMPMEPAPLGAISLSGWKNHEWEGLTRGGDRVHKVQWTPPVSPGEEFEIECEDYLPEWSRQRVLALTVELEAYDPPSGARIPTSAIQHINNPAYRWRIETGPRDSVAPR